MDQSKDNEDKGPQETNPTSLVTSRFIREKHRWKGIWSSIVLISEKNISSGTSSHSPPEDYFDLPTGSYLVQIVCAKLSLY